MQQNRSTHLVWQIIVLITFLGSCSSGTKNNPTHTTLQESNHTTPIPTDTNHSSLTPTNTTTPHTPVKIAIIGDEGGSLLTQSILTLIKEQKTDLLLINGDFDYHSDPLAWERMHQEILGEDFPIIAVAGNHDIPRWDAYQKIIAKWEAHPKLSCYGEPGIRTNCFFEGIQIVSTIPGLYPQQSPQIDQDFIQNSFEKSQSIWRICQWHKVMHAMQTGNKEDRTGWGVYEQCRQKGAMITTGHNHAYARSYLLSSIKDQSIASKSSTLTLTKGKSFVALSGLGGRSSHPLLNDGPWWAAKANNDTQTQAGVLFCTYYLQNTPQKAACYFMDEKGVVLDRFDLISAIK